MVEFMAYNLWTEKGFTIIEVMLASFILLVSLIGGSVFFFSNRRNLVYATRERLAMWSAIYKVEELKGADYGMINPETENISLSGISARRITTVEEIDEDDPPDGTDYKKITVKVDWGSGETSLVSYIAPK